MPRSDAAIAMDGDFSAREALQIAMLRHPGWHRSAVALAAGLLTALLTGPAHAQSYPTQYVATGWQSEKGLPQNSVLAMAQDHQGYLWLATMGGLARFDGMRFRVFGADDFPSLLSVRFTSLYAGRSGELWIGTVNSGLIRLRDGLVARYTERDGLPSPWIWSIREDAQSRLWVNTINGLACCAGGKLQAYPTYQGKAVSEFFLQARDGSMWFRSGTDVVRFGADGSIATLAGGFMVQEDRDGSVWVAFQHQYRLARYHQGVFCDVLLPAAGGRLWSGTDLRKGLLAPPADPRQAVLAMATDTDGELLLLTPAGLVRAVNGRLSPPEALSLPANIGDSPKVLSFLVDREGNRWVGTFGRGLFRFRRAPLTAYGKDEGLSDSPFAAVFQDREGRIWLGGDDSLYWFDGRRFHLVPGLTQISAIAQTNDGDLWFGGSGAVYRRRSGVLTRFRTEPLGVMQILQDRGGTIWIVAHTKANRRGLYRFREGEFELIDADVVHMAEDPDGGLWFASLYPPGLRYVRGSKTVRYDEGQGMPATMVNRIYQDPSGALWFPAVSGLYRLRDGRFGVVTARNGLTIGMLGMLDDGEGNLWLPSHQGIFRVSLKEANDVADGRISSISPVSYGVAEGMKTSECFGGEPNAWKARDGRLWFATMRGVVALDPAAGSRLPPPVVIEEVAANGRMLAREGTPSVPAGASTFDFRFTALSLSAPEEVHFKYRLEPYDKEWVDAGTHRTAHYTNMPPGEYSFQVSAANSFGVWNDQGAKVRFELRPHFYQTKWFYAVCAISLLALIWVAHDFRVRRLHREFNRLREVIETIPAYVWSALPDGSLDFICQRLLECTGASREQALGWAWQELVHPEDREPFLEAWRAALASGNAVETEARLRWADGQYRWLLFRNVPLHDKTGKIVKWYGTGTDIHDRKRAEEARKQSEAYLAEAQRLSHTGSWALDLACDKYVYVSEEDSRIWGFDPKDGAPSREAVFQRIHPEDRNRCKELFERSLRDKTDSADEYRILLPDGRVKHVHTIRHLVLNNAGEPVKLVGTSVDITERKRAEEAHRESELRFRTFVDHVADAIVIQDDQGIIVDANRQGCEGLGYTRQEVIGKTPCDSFCLNIDGQAADLGIATRAAAGETVFETHSHRHKDGTVFPVEVHTRSFWYSGRRLLLKVARDISDRLRAEKERERLRQLEADLAHINRVSMLGELAASVAHEVNQPISGVVSNGSACLRWLGRDAPDIEEAREAARRIVRDGKRAGEIISRIRALTKRAATPIEKLDLNETIREVLALIGDEAKRKSVMIRTHFADDLCTVSGDRVQLQQVMLNLVMNGIEAMSSVDDHARELTITTRNLDAGQVQVTVDDSGTGLDPNVIDKIFDPFYTTKSGGMGMGLSICRSILQMHGGRIWASANNGRGTSFHFTLPKYHEEESHADTAAV